MLAAIISIPLLLLGLLLFYFAYVNVIPLNLKWIGVIPFSIGLASYIIRHGINEWWYSKHPPKLGKQEKNILVSYFPYYNNLAPELQEEFEARLSVFSLQKKFQMRRLEKIPGDLQLLVCAIGIQITMGLEKETEFLKNLGMVVLFPRKFITPHINTKLHYVEVNKDIFDCLLLSIDLLAKGLGNSQKYYNIGLHGMAKVFKIQQGISDEDIPYSGSTQELLTQLHDLRKFKVGYQSKYTGLPTTEIFEMATEHFFVIPKKLKEKLPELYNYLMGIYQQDPSNTSSPTILKNK